MFTTLLPSGLIQASEVKTSMYKEDQRDTLYVATIMNPKGSQVYSYDEQTGKMNRIGGKRFETQSKWATDRKRTLTNGSIYFRVSSNEWVSSDDAIAPEFMQSVEPNQNQDSSIVGSAEEIMKHGTLKYSNADRVPAGSEEFIKNGDASILSGGADCSSFVWLVLKRAGYNVGSYAFSTPTMESDAKTTHKYLKEIAPEDAQPGDLVIVNKNGGEGQNGHTAILMEEPSGSFGTLSDDTMVIQMGGITGQTVNIDRFNRSFMVLLEGNSTVTYARPIAKK